LTNFRVAGSHANGEDPAVWLLQGLDIAITPHLDDGLEYGGWRNALWFDPLQKYGGFSYYEVSPAVLQAQHGRKPGYFPAFATAVHGRLSKESPAGLRLRSMHN
jgi:hypothetical protein